MNVLVLVLSYVITTEQTKWHPMPLVFYKAVSLQQIVTSNLDAFILQYSQASSWDSVDKIHGIN